MWLLCWEKRHWDRRLSAAVSLFNAHFQCSIFIHISAKGLIMGPLETAVSSDVVFSASQKKGTGFAEPPRGQQH